MWHSLCVLNSSQNCARTSTGATEEATWSWQLHCTAEQLQRYNSFFLRNWVLSFCYCFCVWLVPSGKYKLPAWTCGSCSFSLLCVFSCAKNNMYHNYAGSAKGSEFTKLSVSGRTWSSFCFSSLLSSFVSGFSWHQNHTTSSACEIIAIAAMPTLRTLGPDFSLMAAFNFCIWSWWWPGLPKSILLEKVDRLPVISKSEE